MHLSIKSANQLARFFFEKYAFFSQVAGTLLNDKAYDKSSIASVILRAPVKPNFKSSNDVLISPNKTFILSHS